MAWRNSNWQFNDESHRRSLQSNLEAQGLQLPSYPPRYQDTRSARSCSDSVDDNTDPASQGISSVPSFGYPVSSTTNENPFDREFHSAAGSSSMGDRLYQPQESPPTMCHDDTLNLPQSPMLTGAGTFQVDDGPYPSYVHDTGLLDAPLHDQKTAIAAQSSMVTASPCPPKSGNCPETYLPCPFSTLGCHDMFIRTNEWKRHCIRQHLMPEFWQCQEGTCGTRMSDAFPSLGRLRGNVFNRKDLYVAHIKRIHAVVDKTRQGTMHQKARVVRFRLPQELHCPVSDCHKTFHGDRAFNSRMDHVAKHHRASAAVLGTASDPTLRQWMRLPEVGILPPSSSASSYSSPRVGEDGGERVIIHRCPFGNCQQVFSGEGGAGARDEHVAQMHSGLQSVVGTLGDATYMGTFDNYVHPQWPSFG